ncbi:MAG: sulfite exporter TauE/SafE family protein [Tepidamorphaceae bacterium]|nr:sulfite exporter TauE/SafE family protein [Rhodobiaceae bacterium]MCC0050058.1 sulfite exporter TauE/SafE family protein [Rhodobiaceae bacterium]
MIAALDFPPHILALVAGTFLIAGFVKGVVGMGFPTISVGVMTAAIGLQPALTLAVIPAIATNVWQALSGGHLGELLRRFWLFFLSAVAFTWVGVAIVVQFAHPLLPLVLAVSLILHSGLSLAKIKPTIPAAGETWLSPALGAITGVLMGLTGSGTVPSVYYFDALGLDRYRLVQTLGILFLTLTIALGVSLAGQKAYDMHMLTLSIAGLVPTTIGLYAGQHLRHRMSETAFRRTLYVALMVLGVVIIFRTFS